MDVIDTAGCDCTTCEALRAENSAENPTDHDVAVGPRAALARYNKYLIQKRRIEELENSNAALLSAWCDAANRANDLEHWTADLAALIRESAPLAWAVTGDEAAAKAWEDRAATVLEAGPMLGRGKPVSNDLWKQLQHLADRRGRLRSRIRASKNEREVDQLENRLIDLEIEYAWIERQIEGTGEIDDRS